MRSEWIVWQLADSAFPSGGFAHSGGLESAWRWGTVDGADHLEQFVRASLVQAGRSLLPLLAASHREPGRVEEFDRLCDSLLNNHVANRASRAQGQSFLAAAETAFQQHRLSQLRTSVSQGQLAGHLAPLFGAVTSGLNIPADDPARVFLYTVLRDLVSSAVRLNIIGPFQGQSIQYRLGPFAEEVAGRSTALSPDDVAQTAPVIELLQQTHDRLYTRLFQS